MILLICIVAFKIKSNNLIKIYLINSILKCKWQSKVQKLPPLLNFVLCLQSTLIITGKSFAEKRVPEGRISTKNISVEYLIVSNLHSIIILSVDIYNGFGASG